MRLELTQEQLYELNDAAHEVIQRMIEQGQTPEEKKFQSLRVLFSALQALHLANLGTADTPGLRNLEPRVMAAMGAPHDL